MAQHDSARTRLLMVSLDAVDSRDVETLLTLPHFSALRAQGTLARSVDSVFVSNTYVAHTSIITGTLPQRHGIVENLRTEPGSPSPGWRRDAREIRVPTLWRKAAQAGLSVCSVMYPVTGYAPIRWNLVEVPDGMSLPRRAFTMLREGGAGFTLDAALHSPGVHGAFPEPWLDAFTSRFCAHSIRRRRPDLTLLHLIDTDFHKHRYGPRSEQARQSLLRHDERLGALWGAMREAFGESAALLVFSDHGSLPAYRRADPNEFLLARGFIRRPARAARDFDVFSHNAGGCFFLKLLSPARRDELLGAVPALLREPYVRRRLTEEEMARSGMAEEFLLGFEAQDGYTIGAKMEHGEHGYSLQRPGYHPFYLAVGPGVPKGGLLCGENVAGASILDICPLAADLLGLPLWPMQGVDRVLPSKA